MSILLRQVAEKQGIDPAEFPRVNPVLECDPAENLTRQSEKDACDINRIVYSYVSQGIPLPEGGVYGDFSSGLDYRETLDKARELQEFFASLPAVMRDKYRNDPAEFLDRVLLPENLEDAVALGLAEKPEVPVEVPATPPA